MQRDPFARQSLRTRDLRLRHLARDLEAVVLGLLVAAQAARLNHLCASTRSSSTSRPTQYMSPSWNRASGASPGGAPSWTPCEVRSSRAITLSTHAPELRWRRWSVVPADAPILPAARRNEQPAQDVSEQMKSRKPRKAARRGNWPPSVNIAWRNRLKLAQSARFRAMRKPLFTVVVTAG